MSDEPMILLAARVGEASQGPARTAAWLGTSLGARITVLHVAMELQTAAQVASGTGMGEAEVRERMKQDARERADDFARDTLGGVPYDIVVAEAPVAESVSRLAAEIGAVLVVAGSRAQGAIRSAILGDTTQEILRDTRCPVVVVPPGVGTD